MRKVSYTADFETNTSINDASVWAWRIADITALKVIYKGNTLDDFFATITDNNCDIYFHNLKFDGFYIIQWLLRNGYEYSKSEEEGTFNTLITDTNLFYKITIVWKRFKKRVVKTEIYDSLKKLPFKVEEIAKGFNLPIKKGSIDYDKYRPLGYELTKEEDEYVDNDVLIMAHALHQQMLLNGLKKMTIGSDALSGFKEMTGVKNFEHYFPVLDVDVDAQIRLSYKGGFTFLSPRYIGQRKKGLVFDVNSLYPSVMYNSLLPYGEPLIYEGEYEDNPAFPLFIQRISCSFKLKEGHIPTIQLKNNRAFIPTEYLKDSNGEIVDLTLTSVDLKLFLEHYEVLNLEYGGGYMFKGSRAFFKDYIDFWSNEKIEAGKSGNKAKYLLAKLMLNSLYGKFATATTKRTKHPVLNKDTGTLSFVLDEERITKPVYTALACFITAYAREKTITSAQNNFERFIYADTDSIHLEGHNLPDNIDIDAFRLGAWKHESTFDDSVFLRAKTYMEYERGRFIKKDDEVVFKASITDDYLVNEWKITCAGMPDLIHPQVTPDNFRIGTTYFGKLRPKQVPFGLILEKTTFKIKGEGTMNESEYDLSVIQHNEMKDYYKAEYSIIKQYFHKITINEKQLAELRYRGLSASVALWSSGLVRGVDIESVCSELQGQGIFIQGTSDIELLSNLIDYHKRLLGYLSTR